MSRYLTLYLNGADGSRWNLTDATEGVMLRPGPQKIIDAPAKTFWLETSTGSHYQGMRFERRDPVFSVQIHHENPDIWADIDSRFRMALGMYDEEFELEAHTSYGVRRLKMRLLTDPVAYANADYEGKDPWLTHDSTLGISAACGMPFWEADPIEMSWALGSGTSGSTRFEFENRGDVVVWPRYFVTAPGKWRLPDRSWGQKLYAIPTPPYHRGLLDADRMVWLPELVAGEDCSVDTDPDEATLVAANGAPVQARWNSNGLLYPLRAHLLPTQVTVEVTNANPGAAITIWLPRRYSRPWGVMV
ncbi:hypothetical protein [Nocardia transvalensis]|uniref:hypothetical protein n=1 Tax=Nocardia transvalensis TaxID=37333 RepID=UPI001895F23F|nr:hypothetical protein [Nocardia transvalensis]MBF6328728.1 hypothetical protein [Nocardia transvalensis]